jgi:hypothetical protein
MEDESAAVMAEAWLDTPNKSHAIRTLVPTHADGAAE